VRPAHPLKPNPGLNGPPTSHKAQPGWVTRHAVARQCFGLMRPGRPGRLVVLVPVPVFLLLVRAALFQNHMLPVSVMFPLRVIRWLLLNVLSCGLSFAACHQHGTSQNRHQWGQGKVLQPGPHIRCTSAKKDALTHGAVVRPFSQGGSAAGNRYRKRGSLQSSDGGGGFVNECMISNALMETFGTGNVRVRGVSPAIRKQLWCERSSGLFLLCRQGRIGGPAFGALDGLLPAGVLRVDGCAVRCGLEELIGAGLRDLVDAGPEAGGKAGKVSRALRRRFEDRRAADGDAEQVGLELHEQIVGRSAAVDAQLATVPHGVNHVGNLEGDALDGRAGDVADLRTAADADDQSSGMRVPVGRAEAGKGGDENDAVGMPTILDATMASEIIGGARRAPQRTRRLPCRITQKRPSSTLSPP